MPAVAFLFFKRSITARIDGCNLARNWASFCSSGEMILMASSESARMNEPADGGGAFATPPPPAPPPDAELVALPSTPATPPCFALAAFVPDLVTTRVAPALILATDANLGCGEFTMYPEFAP